MFFATAERSSSITETAEAEDDDHEVDVGMRRGDRRDPAALARALVADARDAGAAEPARLGERGDGVAREQLEVLRVRAAGLAGAALVEHEGADALARQPALQRIEAQRRVMLGAVQQHDHGHAVVAGRQHQAADELHAVALEARRRARPAARGGRPRRRSGSSCAQSASATTWPSGRVVQPSRLTPAWAPAGAKAPLVPSGRRQRSRSSDEGAMSRVAPSSSA